MRVECIPHGNLVVPAPSGCPDGGQQRLSVRRLAARVHPKHEAGKTSRSVLLPHGGDVTNSNGHETLKEGRA